MEHDVPAEVGSLRFIRSASASLPHAVLEGLENHFGVPVIETYGMTEAASQIASNPLPPRQRKAGSVGPAAGPEVAIWNDDAEVLDHGEIGEIMLRGPNVTRGYQSGTDDSRTAFVNGWFRSGDQGYLDEDGYLFITGRLKEMINRGGQNIAPPEIEDALLTHPAVAQAVAFSLPHPTLGEEVGAAVVANPGTVVDVEDLRRFAAAGLAGYKLPRHIAILDDLPKGPTGKLQRIGLAQRLGLVGSVAKATETRPSNASPPTHIERQLTDIWRDVLKVEQIGRDDDFFLLGGDSLSATQVLSRVATRLQAKVPLPTFFERPTIAALAEAIEAAPPVDEPSRPQNSDERSTAPLSYQQERLYFLDRLTSGANSHHVVELVHLQGEVEPAALQQALAATIERHDILRTVIQDDGGKRTQSVLANMPSPFAVRSLEPSVDAGTREESLTREIRSALCQPFDLESGPLLRIQLLRLGEQVHVLLLIAHHLITDGWSQRLFWKELERRYNALLGDELILLPAPGLTYGAFATEQRRWVESPAADPQRRYWERQLVGLTMLPLPIDKARPKSWNGRGARWPLQLSRNHVKRLKTLGQRQRCTTFMTLLAVFQTLLHRYSDHADVAVGSLIANRNSLAGESLLGMLANTTLLRTDFSGDPSFETVLQRVRVTTLDAYRYQELPFEEILSNLPVCRHLDRSAPFPALFLLHGPKPEPPKLLGAASTFLAIDPGTARFDLTLELAEEDGELSGWFEYSTDLFEASTIECMAGHFLTLLEAATADPAVPVKALPLLTDTECHQIERETEGPKRHPPKGRSISALFEQQAALSADATAVIMGDARLSFTELNQRANQLAHHLIATGVGGEDFVGLMVERSPAMVVAVLGILKAGAAFVPLDPEYPKERLAFILEDGNIRTVVTRGDLVKQLAVPGLCPICLDGDRHAIEQQPASNLDLEIAPPNLAYVLYTSGSTGRPKGVLGTQQGLLHILDWVWRTLPFEAGEVCCHKTSISFGDALQELFAPLLQGHPVVLIDKEALIDLDRFVGILARRRIRRIVLVPSLLRAMLAHIPALNGRLPDLQLWISSGEAIASDLTKQFRDRLPGRRLINVYGASEMADIVTWHEVGDTGCNESDPPIGRPIDNVDVHILDEAQQRVPRGVPGELYVSSPGLARGYHNRPKLERATFLPNPFNNELDGRLYRTGDRARIRSDGKLDYLGRRDQQVQIRGCRVELGEIEHAFLEHPKIHQAAVLAEPDRLGDPGLVAFIQPANGESIDSESLHHVARSKLPDYMLPSLYHILSELPLTPSGKIDRQALKTLNVAWPPTASTPRQAGSPTEELLIGIWSDLLKTDRLGIGDNFFELGGHSLLAGQVLARIGEIFHVSLPLRALFEQPTIAELACLINASQGDRPVAEEPMIEPLAEGAPRRPSKAQEHVFKVEQQLPGLPIFNLPYSFRLRGRLNIGVLERAVNQTIQRHEALRTRFDLDQDRIALIVDNRATVKLAVEDVQGGAEEASRLAKEEAWTPFDTGILPLLRIRLLKVGMDDYVCLVTIHHIIADGWSIGMLVRDIAAGYNAELAGQPERPALEPAPTWSSIAAWQYRWCDSDVGAYQRAFWMRTLQQAAKARETADETNDAALSFNVAHLPIRLPAKLTMRLKAFAKAHGGTLYMTLLAGLIPVLGPMLGRSELVIGTIMANRTRQKVEHVFGPLENITLLPLEVQTERPLADTMRQVRRIVFDAAAHQDLPFDHLAEAWWQDGKETLTALIDAMFVFQDAMRDSLDLNGLDVAPFGDLHRTGQPVLPITSAKLTIILREAPAGIIGSCVFKADKIKPEQISQLLGTYVDLLDQVE